MEINNATIWRRMWNYFLPGPLKEPECLCFGNGLLAIMSGEFSVYIVCVSFDGSRGDEQPLRDFLVAQSNGQEIDDIELPVGQRFVKFVERFRCGCKTFRGW